MQSCRPVATGVRADDPDGERLLIDSKPGVIWIPFAATIKWLEESMRSEEASDDPLFAVREVPVSSTRSAVSSSDVDEADDTLARAVARACHGVFVAEVRHWQNTDDDRDGLLQRLDDRLEQVCSAFEPLFAVDQP